MPPSTNLRAAVYPRLSEETENTTSPERQRALSRAYAEARDWSVLDADFSDIDVSATKTGLDRPGLTRLRQAIARGEVDVVIVWRLDRLARSLLDLLTLLKEWGDAGVAVASATEPVDLTTPIGKAMVALIGIFAEMEAEAIRSRVKGSIDALRRDGRFAGGTVPYGYAPVPRTDGPGRALAVLPEEAAVVKEAAERALAGEAAYRICRDFNVRELAAPRSEFRRLARAGRDASAADRGRWRVQSLVRLLTSDHLAGRVTHRGEVMRGPDGLPVAVWEPILRPADLARLRALLSPETASQRPRRVRQARLLSGLVRCASCGSKMYVRTSSGRPIYGCPQSARGETCPSPRVSAEALEAFVERSFLESHGEAPETRTVAVVDEAGGVDLSEVEESIRQTTAALGADDADVPALLARLGALKATRLEQRARAASPSVLYAVEATGRSWAEAWTEESMEGRRALLELVVDGVRVAPTTSRSPRLDEGRVEVRWA